MCVCHRACKYCFILALSHPGRVCQQVFDWDNIFAAYMFGALGESAAKASAYSSLIQVIRSKTKNGFVPNYAAGGAKSQDRSEEIIGSKAIHISMYVYIYTHYA